MSINFRTRIAIENIVSNDKQKEKQKKIDRKGKKKEQV